MNLRCAALSAVLAFFPCAELLGAASNVPEGPAPDTSAIVGPWSKTVTPLFGPKSQPSGMIRGRLVIAAADAIGLEPWVVYVEIEQLRSGSLCQFTFNRDKSLTWKLTDSAGKEVPAWRGPVPWVFDYGSIDDQLSLPRGLSRIRFEVCRAEFAVLIRSHASVLFLGLIGTPPWELPVSGALALSAEFKDAEPMSGPVAGNYHFSLSLPPVGLPRSRSPVVY